MVDVERVVLVHRLREVVAQVGFTRFEAVAPDVDGELEMGVRRAALAREAKWLPAVENQGEGVFLGMSRESIQRWLALPAVKRRGDRLVAGFAQWQAEHPGSARQFPGLPFVLLHSLSHLWLTAVALDCGYPASSIRERVYAGPAGYGILLYTGSPDAEGTLGGLVESGRRIASHLRTDLERCELCSNDPVCAYHAPDDPNEAPPARGAGAVEAVGVGAVDPAEERAHLAGPRHRRELVDGRDEEAREPAVDWLVDRDDRVRAPGHVEHRFRRKPNTHSGPSRTPIPTQAEHRFRAARTP
jgi:hypothetical protein